jgi:excisionase family DNA binding protein
MIEVGSVPYTVDQVAELCQVKPAAVRKWIKAGKIAAIRLPGGQYRIPRDQSPVYEVTSDAG